MFERIGIIAKRDDPGAGPTVTRAAHLLTERDVQVRFDTVAAGLLGRAGHRVLVIEREANWGATSMPASSSGVTAPCWMPPAPSHRLKPR